MKLNNKRTVLVGLAFLSICAFWQMYDNVVPLILTKTFHLNETFSGTIMAADNVLALFVNYSKIEGDEYGRLEAELTSGTGYYAKGGRIIELSWVFSEEGGLVLMHPDGRELRLTAGSSFICCPDSQTGKVMASYDVNK